MKQTAQFTIGLIVGLFVWRFYDLIHMAVSDGLAYFGVVDPYMQAIIVLAVLGFVIFVLIHGGSRKLMEEFA